MTYAKRDYYKVLGIAPVATQEEVKKAYRAASKKWHPDLNPELKLVSEEKMRELVEAYEVLSDLEKRKEYERQPHFQIRRVRKYFPPGAKPPQKGAPAPLKRESSLLDRLFAPFTRKKDLPLSPDRIDPKSADTHFTLGLSMAQNDAFLDQAINEFRLSVKFDPDHLEAMYNLGLVCHRKGLFEEALVYFQKVLAISKTDAHARKMISLLRDDF